MTERARRPTSRQGPKSAVVSTAPRAEAKELAEVERELDFLVRRIGPGLCVERKWAVDWCVGVDLVVCVGQFSHHVAVEFWRGRSLVDAGHPLEGTGKNLRHLKIRSLDEARKPAVRRAIQAAVQLDQRSPKRVRQAAHANSASERPRSGRGQKTLDATASICRQNL